MCVLIVTQFIFLEYFMSLLKGSESILIFHTIKATSLVAAKLKMKQKVNLFKSKI